MTDAEILAGLAALARQHLRWEGTLAGDQRLVEDLELDSLQQLTLMVEVENAFRIRLDADAETGIETVADLVTAIRTQLAGRTEENGNQEPS